jgi:hypothetical protein
MFIAKLSFLVLSVFHKELYYRKPACQSQGWGGSLCCQTRRFDELLILDMRLQEPEMLIDVTRYLSQQAFLKTYGFDYSTKQIVCQGFVDIK